MENERNTILIEGVRMFYLPVFNLPCMDFKVYSHQKIAKHIKFSLCSHLYIEKLRSMQRIETIQRRTDLFFPLIQILG